MKKIIFIAIFLAGILNTSIAQGELEARIQEKRVDFFNTELQLTDSEADQFWPLYDQYRGEKESLKKSYNKNQKLELMSDKEVEGYIFASFELQEKELALRRKYFEKLRGFLPIRKIALLNRTEQKFKRKLLQHVKQRRKSRLKGEQRLQKEN